MLDNCEHLLRAVAALVTSIEGACPGVRVLATSREGLNVRGEQILVVPSFGLPEEEPPSARWAGVKQSSCSRTGPGR